MRGHVISAGVLTVALAINVQSCAAGDWINNLWAAGSPQSGQRDDSASRTDAGFVERLFNFRPWTGTETRPAFGVPGLPIGRRYFGGRYFGQFNNRFYGPQYGNF